MTESVHVKHSLSARLMIHAENMQSEGWYTTANVLAEAAGVLAWQPIETAPKGVQILAHLKAGCGNSFPFQCVVWIGPPYEAWAISAVGDAVHVLRTEQIHAWMPLPTPPEPAP